MGLLDAIKKYGTPVVDWAAPRATEILLDTVNLGTTIPTLIPNEVNKYVVPIADRALPLVAPGIKRTGVWVGTDALLAANFAHRPAMSRSGGASPKTTGNAIDVLVDTQYRDALIDAIKHAESSIWIESFQWYDDVNGNLVAKAILDRQAELGRPLDVRILYDNRDSPQQVVSPKHAPDEPAFFKTMRAAGMEVHRVQYAGGRINHRKITVIDGKTSFIGGQNIGDAYMSTGAYHDTTMRVRGPATYDAAVVFKDSWARSGGSALTLPARMSAVNDSGAQVQVISHSGGLDRNVEREMVAGIDGENGEVILGSGFGMSDQIRDALLRARKRGVKVTWMWGHASHAASLMAQEAFPALRKAGVNLMNYPNALHMKAMYFRDSDLLIQGSSNFDGLSTFLNDEAVLKIKGGGVPRDFYDRVFAPDLARSTPITGTVEKATSVEESIGMKVFERLVDNDSL